MTKTIEELTTELEKTKEELAFAKKIIDANIWLLELLEKNMEAKK